MSVHPFPQEREKGKKEKAPQGLKNFSSFSLAAAIALPGKKPAQKEEICPFSSKPLHSKMEIFFFVFLEPRLEKRKKGGELCVVSSSQ